MDKCGSGIQDPGWKNSDPGFGIKIADPQHCIEMLLSKAEI
jgi:hypothetical protein